MKKLYKAEWHIQKWADLDIDFLKKQHIEGVLLDVNGTLMSRGKLVPGAQRILRRLQDEKIKIAILTNNTSVNKQLLKILQLDKKYIQTFAMKPFPYGYQRMETRMGCLPENLAMITNNSLLDIVGANIRGMHTIKVLEHETKVERTIRKCHAGIERRFISQKKEKQKQKAFRAEQRISESKPKGQKDLKEELPKEANGKER